MKISKKYNLELYEEELTSVMVAVHFALYSDTALTHKEREVLENIYKELSLVCG